jgi:hypothetical protein
MITENMNGSEDIDPHAKLLNKILSVRLRDGFQFSAKLVATRGKLLYFQNREGRIFADHIDTILSIQEMV